MSDFERVGGEEALREIVSRFIDRCYADMMIGYLFKRADPARVKRFEYEHLASFLGAPLGYGGRPLRDAHARHGIVGAQFDRRLRILTETLETASVPADIVARILDNQRALRGLVLGGDEARCAPSASAEPGSDVSSEPS